jgi:hypothetical protein
MRWGCSEGQTFGGDGQEAATNNGGEFLQFLPLIHSLSSRFHDGEAASICAQIIFSAD